MQFQSRAGCAFTPRSTDAFAATCMHDSLVCNTQKLALHINRMINKGDF